MAGERWENTVIMTRALPIDQSESQRIHNKKLIFPASMGNRVLTRFLVSRSTHRSAVIRKAWASHCVVVGRCLGFVMFCRRDFAGRTDNLHFLRGEIVSITCLLTVNQLFVKLTFLEEDRENANFRRNSTSF